MSSGLLPEKDWAQEPYEKCSKSNLKETCGARNLSIGGQVAFLIQRLRAIDGVGAKVAVAPVKHDTAMQEPQEQKDDKENSMNNVNVMNAQEPQEPQEAQQVQEPDRKKAKTYDMVYVNKLHEQLEKYGVKLANLPVSVKLESVLAILDANAVSARHVNFMMELNGHGPQCIHKKCICRRFEYWDDFYGYGILL